MKYTSRGTPQKVARNIQMERMKLEACEIVWIEKGIGSRQEIVKHSKRRSNGTIRISRAARELHGMKF